MSEIETQTAAETTATEETNNLTENAAQETATEALAAETSAAPEVEEEISYHAVEKEGKVTALWEMQGRKHLRTIDPRSGEGKHLLSLFTADHHEEAA